jgi:tetratricopeptide (TPR) repeat protein
VRLAGQIQKVEMHKMIRRVAAVGGFALVIAASTTWAQDSVRGTNERVEGARPSVLVAVSISWRTPRRLQKGALALNPQRGLSHYWLGLAELAQGRPTEALETVERERHLTLRRLGLAPSQPTLGRRAESDAGLRQLIKMGADGSACQIAEAYAYCGAVNVAFEWLERAYVQRAPGLSVAKSALLLRNLHGDRRWQPFLKKMGLTG